MHMDELKSQKVWLCWNYETRKGKRTKVPISASGTATGTNSEYAHTWVTYDEAVKAAEERGYNGVGFKIPQGYFFLDIDHKELTDPFVQLMLERFNSYAEYSVSGGGIHIYGKCTIDQVPTCFDKDGKLRLDKAFYMKNPHNSTELYCGGITNRFAVYVIRDVPLKECTDALLVTLDKDMRRQQKVKYSGKRDGDDRELFDIVADLLKQRNGEKFRKLYSDGDFSDYGSQSEADCALCAMIAFRTGADPEMIDRVFRSSALYREKWEREDYRTATIEKGIEACHGTFHKSKMEHPYFARFNEATEEPYIVTPLLARYVREHMNYILVRDNGKQGLLKYVYENGCYRLYSNDMFMGIIKQCIADYDEELVKMSKVAEVLQHITTDLNYISQEELDADENLINFKNGLPRITETGTVLIPHTPTVYSTIQIPCDWTSRPEPTPVFDAYMRTLTNGDKAVEQLLLEFMGICISNIKGWRMKKALFLVGDGDTGKSQLKSLVERLLGKGNFIGIDLKEIEARFGTGAIYGTRLAGSSDMSFLSVDELKTFKKATGGDSLYAEFKGQQAFEFAYNGLLWFCMNRLPKFGGDNGQWVYDRIMVVRCPNVIPKDRQDKQLLDKMYAERNGIVYKAIQALQAVIRNGYRFSEPESISAARTRYMSENSTVVSFFEECMCPWQNGRIQKHCTTGRIYRVYQAWCRDNNNGFSKTAKEFRKELAEHLGKVYAEMTTRQKGNTYYKSYEKHEKDADRFIALIDKYENFDKLTIAMLNEFIEKILVHERDRKGSIQTTQEVEIYFNFVGRFVPPAYVWGGSSPATSFDCSGYVSWVINHSGWNVGRLGAQGLYNICTPISSPKPGDLVFFKGTYDTPGVSHCGIYVSDGKMLHCGDPIGYAKGKYQFFVCTHTDKAHIHNHIYFNATAFDRSRKFHNFIGSSFALRRLSDRVCIEHELSVIQNPRQHSKGRFLHYGQWIGEKPPSAKQRVRLAVLAALEKKPTDFADFLRLMEESGFAVKQGRGGVISFLAPGQEKPTRLRASTLGAGFDPEDIKAVIAGERPLPELPEEPSVPPRRVNLIIDIQERMAQGKGPAYERWAKVYNLKQMAAALQYLQEHHLTDYAALTARTEAAVDHFHKLSDELRTTEEALSKTSELMAATVDYAKTRPVFDGYKAARYSKKYLAQHEAELATYRAAKDTMNTILNGAKLPKIEALKKSRRELAGQKKELYAEYREAQRQMREAVAIKANIDHLLGMTDERENKAQER